MKGIDVSHYNRNINWQKVRNEGIEAVYIKATEGTTYVDPLLNSHYNGVQNAGIAAGFYHFLTGLSAPETQAENFYKNIENKNISLRACLDVETAGFDVNGYIRRFIEKFSSLSSIPIVIYSGAYYAKYNISSDIKSAYPLWVAHYGVEPWGSNINTGFSRVIGHQYTETGRISGVPGYCDLDVFNNEILISNSQPQPQPQPSYVHNEKIRQLQAVCNEVNNSGLAEDGYWGPLTDAAVRNLPLAGLPYRTPKVTTWVQLRVGTTPDGIFGLGTYNAVVGWQSSHGLVPDGLAGYNTIKSLAYA